MGRYRLSPKALEDLDDVWIHIATDNIPAADRLIDKLIQKIQLLASQPGMWRARPELAESLRSFPVGDYVIFYRRMRDGVDVVRVLTGFRDLPDLFEGE